MEHSFWHLIVGYQLFIFSFNSGLCAILYCIYAITFVFNRQPVYKLTCTVWSTELKKYIIFRQQFLKQMLSIKILTHYKSRKCQLPIKYYLIFEYKKVSFLFRCTLFQCEGLRISNIFEFLISFESDVLIYCQLIKFKPSYIS